MLEKQVSFKIFFWSVFIFGLDQFTKQVIVWLIPLNSPTPLWSVADGLLNIIHIRNENVAFSLGRGLPPTVKFLLFIVLAFFILAFLALSLIYDKKMSLNQRRLFAVILGGGMGNLFDRVFRTGGVVDFIDVDIPNIDFLGFSMQRWPVFNFADSSILIAIVILLIPFSSKKKKDNSS